MKDKFGLTKIENPYKVFLRNIQIGIFVILFLFGSVFTGTAIFNKNNADNVLADTAYKCTFSLDRNGGSGGTSTIYVKKDGWFFGATAGGYWLDSACSSERMYDNSNAIAKPTRTGYDFAGYYTERTGGSRRITADGYLDSNVPHTNEFSSGGTWYAHWTPKTYTITLYSDSVELTKLSYTFSESSNSVSFNVNQNETIRSKRANGYYISSWKVSTAVSGVTVSSVSGSGFIRIPANLCKNFSVTAVFTEIEYSIQYDYAGGTAGSYNPSSAKYNSNVQISNPTKTGYYFAGWKVQNVTSGAQYMYAAGPSGAAYQDISEGSIVRARENVSGGCTYFRKLNVNGNTVKLTATWDAQYTIEFKGISKSSQLCTVGYSVPLGSPTKTGYTFTGWTSSTSDGLGSAASLLDSRDGWRYWSGILMKCADSNTVKNLRSTPGTVVVTAHFDPITYIVKIDKGDGTSITTQTVSYDSNFKITTPTKSGVEFKGWKFTSSNNGKYSSNALRGSDLNNLIKFSYNSLSDSDDIYFKNLATQQSEIVTLTGKWTPTIHYYTLEDKYSYDKKVAGIDIGWQVDISIENYNKIAISNYVGSTYNSKKVLGVFTSNQFTKDSIIGTYNISLTSYVKKGYDDFYVLLDNTDGKKDEAWNYDSNREKYTIKVKLTDVQFNYNGKSYLPGNAFSLKSTQYTISLGVGYDFASDKTINYNGNSLLKSMSKSFIVKNGWNYLNASSVYFFMDINKNLWAWDGNNADDVGINLGKLRDKSGISEGKSFDSRLTVNLKSNVFEVANKTDLLNVAQIVNFGGLYDLGAKYVNSNPEPSNTPDDDPEKLAKRGLGYIIRLTADIPDNDVPSKLPSGFVAWWDDSLNALGVTVKAEKAISFYNYALLGGTFDGNDHTIKNLNHTLIWQAQYTTIKNLTINNISINTNGISGRVLGLEFRFQHNGLLAQYATSTYITGVTVNKISGLYSQNSNFGIYSNGILSDVIPTAQIFSKANNLGLIGYVTGKSFVSNCSIYSFSATYNKDSGAWTSLWDSGNVDQYYDEGYNVGGIIGELEGGTIKGCDVHYFSFVGGGKFTSIGGIVGKVVGTSTINECIVGNAGQDSSLDDFFVKTNCVDYRQNFVGGIVGKINGEKIKITNCQNIAKVMDIKMMNNEDAVLGLGGDDNEVECDALNIGGIAGGVIKGSISNSGNLAFIYVDSFVSHSSSNEVKYNKVAVVGGIVGLADLNGSPLTLRKCYNLGAFSIRSGARTDTHRVGGLIGAIYEINNSTKTTTTIQYCYSISYLDYDYYNNDTKDKINCGQFVGRKEYNGKLKILNSYFSFIPEFNSPLLSKQNVVGAFEVGASQSKDLSTTNVVYVYQKGERSRWTQSGQREEINEFVKKINNSYGIVFAFNEYVQYGLPVLANVNNEVIQYKLYNTYVNGKSLLNSTDNVYLAENKVDGTYYLGFGIYNFWTVEVFKYSSSVELRIRKRGGEFALTKAKSNTIGKTFIGYGSGRNVTVVCFDPDLSKTKFTNGYVTISKKDFGDETEVPLTAIFADCLSVTSNINLIDGSITSEPSKTFIEYEKDSSNTFVLEYTGKDDYGNYIYELVNVVSSTRLTYGDFYNTLLNNGIIEKLQSNKLYLSLIQNNVFDSSYSFDFDYSHTNIENLSSTKKVECAVMHYCYGYTQQFALNVIKAAVNDDGALEGWEYIYDVAEGTFAYNIKTDFKEFGLYEGENELTVAPLSEYEISRKGFVFNTECKNVFDNKDENSGAKYFIFNYNNIQSLLDYAKEEFQIFAVYNRGPHLDIDYYDTDGKKLLYSESIPLEKNTSGIGYRASFKDAVYITQDEDFNFAGWWGNSLLNTGSESKNLRVNENTILNSISTSYNVSLYKKIVKDRLSVEEIEKDSNNYHLVYSADDLVYISYLVNQGNKDVKIKLMNDIDLTGYNFVPFSYESTKIFTGEFDGNGYSIRNMAVSGNALVESVTISIISSTKVAETSGLFGYSKGVIKNLNILDAKIYHLGTCESNIGIVAGINTGTIKNVVVLGEILAYSITDANAENIGGIAGVNRSEILESVSHLYSNNKNAVTWKSSILGRKKTYERYVGSLAGQNYGKISDCFAKNVNFDLVGKDYSSCTNSYVKNGSTVSSNFTMNDSWAVADYINDGLPYLVNTGITKVKFINLKPDDGEIFNGANNVLNLNESNKEKTVTKDFFVLDDYSNVYENVLKNIFTDDGYSGYEFVGYSVSANPVVRPALVTTTSTYKDDADRKIDVFENDADKAIYYAVWEAKEYEITVKNTDLVFETTFASDGDFDDIFSNIFSNFQTQMSANYQDIDYFEFTFKGLKFYIDRNGDFVNVANEKIIGKTTHNGISSFFPYMYDEDIELTTHFFNINYKIYVDTNGGEWQNLSDTLVVDDDYRISVSGNGNDKVLFEGLAISKNATENKLTDLDENNKDSKYFYLKGYHVVGFTYLDETSLVDIYKFSDINLAYMQIEGEIVNPEDIYNVRYAVVFAVYEANKYTVTYVAQNNIEEESFEEGFNTILKQQDFTYNEIAAIFGGEEPTIEGYNFIRYEFIYNNIKYYLNYNAHFMNEDGELIDINIDDNICSTFTPYYFTEDLTLNCIFERKDITVEFIGLDGASVYYEIYDKFDLENVKSFGKIYGDDVLEVKYGDSIKAWYFVEHAVKLNTIKLKDTTIFNGQSKINSFTSFAAEYDSQVFNIKNIVTSEVVTFETEKLRVNTEEKYNTENLLEIEDSVYLIYDAQDLYTFFEKYSSSKARLQNNINLAGFTFSVDEFSGELDGNNFTISGLVVANALNGNFGFVRNLTGKIYNLNFDNVILNINSFIFNFASNSEEEIDNSVVNISVVATENNGTIENVYVLGGEFNISIESNSENLVNIGLISVTNNGIISNSCAEVSIDIVNSGATLAFAGISTYNKNLIEKSYFDGTINCNLGTTKGICIENTGTLSASYAYYNSIRERIYNDNDDNNAFFITINNVERLMNVNNTIVSLSHNYSTETNLNGLTTLINNRAIENGQVYMYLYKLNNKVIFNTTNNITTNAFNFNLVIKKSGSDVSSNFVTVNNSTEEEINPKTINYVIKNYAENLSYDLISTPNAWDKLDVKFFIDEESKFSDENIEKILNSAVLKITINEEVFDNILLAEYYDKYDAEGNRFNYFENVESVLYYALSMQNITLKFNDEVKLELRLPSWARFGMKLGVKVNENEKSQYRGERDFDYSFEVKNQAEKIWFYVERSVITLKINLNKDELLESEREYIKFNSEFYNQTDYVFNEADESVTITLYPTLQDGEYIYLAPDISNMLDYDKLGINYSFKGLYEKDRNGELSGIVYDENYSCLLDLERDYDIYIKWEAVEYSIMMVYDESVRYSSYNGFSQTNGYMTKTVRFGDKLTDDNGISVEIPYAIKFVYNFAYKFEGLNIVENDGVVYALTMNENGEPVLFDEYFSRTWTEYRNGTMNGLPKVRLEPVFSEIEFNVELRAEGTIFTTKGEVATSGGTFEDGTQSVIIKMTLSKYLEMKETNFKDIQAPSFEHFEFNGYYVTSPSSLVLNYSKVNNCYNEKECEILLSDIILLSAYNSTFVDVTIHAVDAYSSEIIPFDIISSNDIVEYSFDDAGNLRFGLEYNSTKVTLPEIKIQSQNYLFANYIVNDEMYSKNFVFNSSTDIYLACDYKVTLKTFGATLTSAEFTEEVEAQTYSTYKSSPIIASSQIVLPEISLENYTLQGYKVNGEFKADGSLYGVNEAIEVTKPMIIEVVWSGKIVEVTLNGNGAKVPSTISNFTGFMGYTVIDETHAKIDIVHNTLGSVVANALPTLECNGKTFNKYTVEEQNVDLVNYTFNYEANPTITINAEFLDNEYTINILEDGNIAETIKAKYAEEITSNFIPSLQDLTYCGLSLNQNYLIAFEMPNVMPYLEIEYDDYVEIIDNKVTLTVFAFYLSNSTVQIEANVNAKITNTTELNEFTGGNEFGNPASFKLTVENITTLNFKLPIPEVQNELEFATFKGYYGYNENNEFVEMVDASGNLTNNFKIKENLVLTMVFELEGYDLVLTGDYSTVVSVGDFEQNGSEFTKHVEFNESVGTLPVLELTNYKFKGFYFSKNTESLLNTIDEQLSDENGVLLSEYANFTMAYINKLKEEGVQIVAKYEQSFATINIKTNNSVLGLVTIPRNEQGQALSYTEIENGYSCVVPSGTSIIISALEQRGAKFTEWTQDKEVSIENSSEKETIVLNIMEEVTIIANFDYIDYNIHYFLGSEELSNITPSTFHMDESVALPNIEIEGFDFLGWYEEKSLITPITNIALNTYKDVTVYAKVKNKQIVVNIYSSLDNYTEKTTFDVAFGLKLDELKDFNSNITGYNLVGLFTEKDGKGYAVNEDSLCIFTDDFNLYAYFTEEIVNTLKGSGTQVNPYKISSEEDLITFAKLINVNLCNSTTTYFELTNNLEVNLTNLLSIGNGVKVAFNANFNGNKNVIYVKGENFNSSFVLNGEGEIESYNGLFGINNGNISNVIIVSDITLSEDYDENYTQLVGNICAVNNNIVTNCIVYTQLNDETTKGLNIGAVSAVNNKDEKLNTVIAVVNGETNYLEQNENHYHKNNVTKPRISNNSYYIYSETDLAWLTTQNRIDYDVYLMKNLDMKGKILSSIKLNKSFYGNGYTISNILVLDGNNLISAINQNCKLEKVNFENVVLFNFTSNVSMISENYGTIEKVLISGMTNDALLVTVNNGNILNTYSISSKNSYYVVNTNNQLVENSYSYINNFVKENNTGTLTNVYDMTSDNYSEIVAQIEQNFDINTETSVWITDENCVMFEQKLPVLKGVGNIYLLITADKEFVTTGSTPYNPINNVLLLKTAENIKIGFEITETYLHISSLTLNNIDIMKNKIGQNIYIDANSLLIENELVVELAKNTVTIDIMVENASYGNIKYNDKLYKQISLEVEYGTTINFSAEALTGYRFGSWNDDVTASDREIIATQNQTFVAYFNKIYEVEVYYSLTDVNCVSKHANFNETEYGLKGTFVSTEFESFEDLYPILIKENYVLRFEIVKMADKITVKLIANWEIDYVKVSISTEAKNYKTSVVSTDSAVDGINVVEQLSQTNYSILRNKNATFTLNLETSYLTKMLINGVDIYSSSDYEIFKTSNEPINVDLTSYTSNDISIEFEVQDIEFNTYFANKDCLIEFTKGYEIFTDSSNENENLRNYITTLKGEEITFKVSFNDYTTLDSIKLMSLQGDTLETELNVREMSGDTYYSFTPTEHTIIVVEVKNKEYTITVNYTEGGKVYSSIESEIISGTSFKFNLAYNGNFVLYVEVDKGYKLTEAVRIVRDNSSSLSLSNSYNFNNVTSDMEISFTFKKQSTWLSVDNENQPINFKLSELKGQGTAQRPYLISNIRDFLTLAYGVNILKESYSGKIFKVSNKDLTFDFSQYNFMPIGTNETTFDGTILGNNLTLKGIKIENGTNVGVFSELGTNGVLKAINVKGTVKAHNLVSGFVGTNNGTIIGCSSNIAVTGINDRANDNNIVAGICAINNGTISQTSFSGSVNGIANIIAGLCGINNLEIQNVYNTSKVELTKNNSAEEIIVAGLVGQNKGTLNYGYNSSTVKATTGYENIKIYGVALNNGTLNNVYYNSSVLTLEDSQLGKTSSELKDEKNEIYQTWNFETIWYFDEQSYDFPKLQTLYEFSGEINFKATFDSSITTKVLFITLTNAYGESYDIVLNSTKLTASIIDLAEGSYTITLRTAYSVSVNSETTATVELSKENGTEYLVEIILTKTTDSGYCSSILI